MTHLLITGDDDLAAEVSRLAAAAAASVQTVGDLGLALRLWGTAPLVLVGADRAGAVGELSPPRRPGVHVICASPPADTLFRSALALGAETVSHLPPSAQWLVEVLGEATEGARAAGVLIGVLGGSGGVGASVLAAAVAQSLAGAGADAPRALTVDLDPLGPGLDRLLGMETVKGVRWEDLSATTGRLSARALRDSVPARGDVAVLGWRSRRPEVVPPFVAREVLQAARRGFDHVVVDLPRHRCPAAEETVATCDHLVVVSGSTLASLSSAARVVAGVQDVGARKHLVVRSHGGVTPEEVSRVLRVPLTCTLGDQRGLDEALDLGAGPLRFRRGTLARAARSVAADVSTAVRAVA